MANIGQRVFAASMAALFLITAIGFSAFVIMDISNSRKKQDAEKTAATAQSQAQSQQAQCTDTATHETLTAPEAFKPEGKIAKLQTLDLEPGTGEEAKAGDCIIAKYQGSLANGTVFEENFTQPSAIAVPIGRGAVIKGWDEGIVGMKAGGTRRLVIPSALAYKDQASEKIPANSDLVFVVKLLEVKKIK